MIFKKLCFAFIVGILLGSSPNTICLATEQDPLFPDELLTKNHIIKGLDLLTTQDSLEHCEPITIRCDMSLKDASSAFCIGSGGAKKAIKLSHQSKKIILLGPNEILAKKECQAYKTFNAFGLVSQQDPELVTVEFNNTTINHVLCVSSFDRLACQGSHRRTWDTKNYQGYGNISFFNGKANYDDIDYHRRFLSSLVKDMTLWFVLGRPSDIEADALNLIFKKKNENQTICRLLIYDIYAKGTQEEDDVFKKFKEKSKNISNQLQYIEYWPVEMAIQKLYRKIYEAMLPEEKAELWGQTEDDWDCYSMPINECDLTSKWNQLEPLIVEDFKKEAIRIITLFDEVTNSK